MVGHTLEEALTAFLVGFGGDRDQLTIGIDLTPVGRLQGGDAQPGEVADGEQTLPLVLDGCQKRVAMRKSRQATVSLLLAELAGFFVYGWLYQIPVEDTFDSPWPAPPGVLLVTQETYN